MALNRIDKSMIDPEFTKEINDKFDEVDAHLAQNAQQARFPFVKGVKQPLVSFTDDDGHPEVLTRLKPLFLAKGIPLSVALYYGSPILNNNLDELLDLQDNHGWEFCSHTMNHTSLLQMTDDEIRDDAVAVKNMMASKGLKCNTLVYPYGEYDLRVCRVVSEHFKQAVSSSNQEENSYPLATHALKRISLPFESKDLNYYKSWVDQAIANKTWVIFELHIGQTSEQDFAMLEQLIDYVLLKNVPVVTYDKAVELIGNRVEVNQIQLNTSGDYFLVDCEGVAYSKQLNKHYELAPYNSYTASQLASEYPAGKVTIFTVNSGGASGFPDNSPGVVITYRLSGNGYDRQEYRKYMSNDIWVRYVNSDGTWTSWVQLANKSYVDSAVSSSVVHSILPTNSFAADTPISEYPSRISTFAVNSSGSTGYPDNSPGLVTTYKISGNGWYRQEFRKYMSNQVFSRYVDGTGAWTTWEKISVV